MLMNSSKNKYNQTKNTGIYITILGSFFIMILNLLSLGFPNQYIIKNDQFLTKSTEAVCVQP